MKKMLVVFTAMMVIGTGTGLNAANVQDIKSEAEFNKLVQSPLAVVMVGSNSCPHCRKMKPIFTDVAQGKSNAVFAYVEAFSTSLTALMGKLNVKNIPTFKIYKNGAIVGSVSGVQTQAQLSSLINK